MFLQHWMRKRAHVLSCRMVTHLFWWIFQPQRPDTRRIPIPQFHLVSFLLTTLLLQCVQRILLYFRHLLIIESRSFQPRKSFVLYIRYFTEYQYFIRVTFESSTRREQKSRRELETTLKRKTLLHCMNWSQHWYTLLLH